MLGSAILFAGVGALAKLAMVDLNTEMVVFFRNFMALAILMPWLLVRHPRSVFHTRRIGLHLLRSAAGLGAMYCIFFALNHLQLGEAILLSFTSPLFIPLVAYWWLKEPVGGQTRLAIVVGFIGVALILKPGYGLLRPAALVGLMAGVLMAVGQVGIRRMSPTEPPERIVFYFTLISTVISAVPLIWSWQLCPGADLADPVRHRVAGGHRPGDVDQRLQPCPGRPGRPHHLCQCAVFNPVGLVVLE